MKFIKHKLGELLRITRGASLPGTGYADEGRYLRLTLANFHEEGGFKDFKSTQGKYFIEPFDSRFIMHKGDLITPLTEQSPGLLGSVAFIPCDDLYIQSQDVGLITCNAEKLDKTFAYYLFLTHSVREQISARSQQTKIRHTSPDKIADVEVHIPNMPTQLRIAGVLGSIDEKIELNRKKIAELEALAKTIYDYWFVQFDFPDKNGKPYKSSGGKMVWNELLKREVPEGWGVKALGDIESSIITGKTPSTTDDENFGGDIPFITIDDLRGHIYTYSSERSLSSKGANSQRGKFIPENSLCVSCIGTVGVIAFNAFRSQTNQQINTIVFSKDFNREFLYFFLTRYFSKATVKTGNTFSNMNKGEFAAIQCLVPCKISLTQFHNLAMPIFEQISVCEYQKRMLTNARDCLLPLLMNGQVEVAG